MLYSSQIIVSGLYNNLGILPNTISISNFHLLEVLVVDKAFNIWACVSLKQDHSDHGKNVGKHDQEHENEYHCL